MFSWSKSDDRVAIVRMNAELRHAQLELLSAECATDRLRLRFSAEDVSRYGEPDVVRKAVASATALHDYYGHLARQVSEAHSNTPKRALGVEEKKVSAVIDKVSQYIRQQRKEYRSQGIQLNGNHHDTMKAFFPADLLSQIRMVELRDHIPNPPFFGEVIALGFTNLPDLADTGSLTFEDVVVFPGAVTERRVFHALVHAVQFRVLGLDRYAELYVRSFMRTRTPVSVSLEMHAFSLESRFAQEPDEPFSVEEVVKLWTRLGRY